MKEAQLVEFEPTQNQVQIEGLNQSIEPNYEWGGRVRTEINRQLNQDIERGGVIGAFARVELFLGSVASHVVKSN